MLEDYRLHVNERATHGLVKVVATPRGRVLGGCSSINAMIYMRGQKEDWDHWASLGNRGWSWDDVLPLFRKLEDYQHGAVDGYGAGGDPTAVAVVSDLYAIARSAGAPPAALPKAAEVPDSVTADFTVPHYLRFVVRDRPGIVAALATILAHYQISIDALLQKPGFPHTALSFVLPLDSCDSAVLNRALEEIACLDFHVEPPLCLPTSSD